MGAVTVSADHVGIISDRVARLNRRADRLGVPAVVLTVSAPRVVAVGEFGAAQVVDITLSATSVGFNGWRFVGSIDHSDGIVRSHPDVEFTGLAAFADEARCEHCAINVARKVTYVVQHEDGAVKQVGSTCIKDFLGHAVNTSVWEATADLIDEADSGGFGAGVAEVWTLAGFLTTTAAVIRTDGWVSRTKAREVGRTSTSDIVLAALTGKAAAYLASVTDEDKATAEAAIEWAEGQDSEASDYAHNVSVIVTAGIVHHRTAGIAASILATFNRAQAQAAERTERQPCPIANGEKAAIVGTVIKTDVKYSEYGARYVFTVQAEDGWLAWGSIPRSLSAVEVGDRVTFEATFEVSEDPTFAFFKRPAKARALAPAA
jgi:hypothetical protein